MINLMSRPLQVLEGAWELCGEYQDAISCVIMGHSNYLDIFDDESVRVTTFRRLELPDSIEDPDQHGELQNINTTLYNSCTCSWRASGARKIEYLITWFELRGWSCRHWQPPQNLLRMGHGDKFFFFFFSFLISSKRHSSDAQSTEVTFQNNLAASPNIEQLNSNLASHFPRITYTSVTCACNTTVTSL